jgi:glycosyltransferase involved in cell wall biosynthesis
MLESLQRQTLASDKFEVVVVDDGSTDGTADLCLRLAADGLIRYRRVTHGGIAQAKNFGLLGARGDIVLFLDDDDVAAPDLLQRHVEMHDRHSAETVAALTVTPLMRYVTEIGKHLFSYPLGEDTPLSYHHFWGGRTSCKRRFLIDHGIFNPAFTSIIEDIELAYRLVPAGLAVLHTRSAVTEMARGFSFDEFCDRCERRGRGLALFAALHPEPEAEEFCRTVQARDHWSTAELLLPEKMARVRELETQPETEEVLAELYELYGWTFHASEAKGVVEAEVAACSG